MYAISRSWMGGVNSGNIGQAPWWKITIDALTISAGVATVALFGMYVFAEIVSKKNKPAPQADAAE